MACVQQFNCRGARMKHLVRPIPFPTVAVSLLALSAAGTAWAQVTPGGDEKGQEVIVTGSRIAQSEAQREQPLSVISNEAIEKTGLAGVGELLQQLTTGGSALNAK